MSFAGMGEKMLCLARFRTACRCAAVARRGIARPRRSLE
ncbi:hypothetical protein Z949_1517 [Sulfitobacter guttiformis KCTC 32187]|nr:hypothetical protein Z949_1517 [Sulfitobacter guttiformis KCTC 32187]